MIKLVFIGKPMSKDNEKIFNKQGRPFLCARYKSYTQDIQKQFLQQKPRGFKLLTEELIVTMRFYFKDKRCLDLSNAPKSILDALTKFVYCDDRQIKELHLFKEYDSINPRVEVMISE